MRGKGIDVNKIKQGERITPAHAGKRKKVIEYFRDIQDHPRTCGEKFSLKSCSLISLGSPSHMWGKVSFPSIALCAVGITPAHVGKSLNLH